MIFKKILTLLDFTLLPRCISNNKTLVFQLVKRNIAIRYRGSALGLIWSFVQHLMMLSIYTFVFSVIFKAKWGVDIGDSKGAFAIIMFCGLALYNIFSESVNTSCQIIISNPNFVKKVIFPLEILPLTQVLSSIILGMVWFILLFLGALLVFGKIYFTVFLFPIIIIPLAFFSLGISYFVASWAVYVRDTQYVIGVLLQIVFFVTPIFYPIQAVPERYRFVLEMNPLTVIIEEARKIFLYGQLPDWTYIGIATLISYIVLHFGFIWFYKTKKGFADVL